MKFLNAKRLATIASLSLIPEVAGCVQVGTQPMSWSGPIYPQGPTNLPGSSPCSPSYSVVRSCGETLSTASIAPSGPTISDLAPISEAPTPSRPSLSTPIPSDVEPITPEPSEEGPTTTRSTQKWTPVRRS